jgi:hypothetical protein
MSRAADGSMVLVGRAERSETRHEAIARTRPLEQSGQPARFGGSGARHDAAGLSRGLHKIKAASDLSGADRVIIYSDGLVTDEQGEPLGNLHDED